jgi:hypothetical protein
VTADQVQRRIGRRGAVLLILAAVDVGVGWSFIDPTDEARKAQNALWREQFMPSSMWGALWIGVAVLCLTAAFSRQDSIGFIPAVTLKMVWATVEFTGWWSGAIDQGYRPGLIWLGFALLIFVVAGLREPYRSPAVEPDGGRTK